MWNNYKVNKEKEQNQIFALEMMSFKIIEMEGEIKVAFSLPY